MRSAVVRNNSYTSSQKSLLSKSMSGIPFLQKMVSAMMLFTQRSAITLILTKIIHRSTLMATEKSGLCSAT